MGKVHDSIDDRFAEFIRQQKLFFVATSPLAQDGLINVSPKGGDAFRILDETTVAYLDLTGSGIETVAHLRENGRIVLMFCAFEGPPKILRLYGRGEVFEPGDPQYEDLLSHFPETPGARAIIRVKCHRVADACGFGVPLYEFQSERTLLQESASLKGEEGLVAYKRKKNRTSLDGLPGLARLD